MNDLNKKMGDLKAELKAEYKVLNDHIKYNRKHLDKLWEGIDGLKKRVQVVEVQLNFNARLLAILCSEKLKMTSEELKKTTRKIQKDIYKAAQVRMLEEMFKREFKKAK